MTEDWALFFQIGGAAIFGGVGVWTLDRCREYRRRRRANKRAPANQLKKLLGSYEGYHLATSGNGNITRWSLLVTSAGDDKPAIIEMKSTQGFAYTGELDLLPNGNNIILSLEGREHPEKALFVLKEPLGPKFECLCGTYSGVSEDWLPVCGKIVLWKVKSPKYPAELSPEETDARLLSYLTRSTSLIRVPTLPKYELDEL